MMTTVFLVLGGLMAFSLVVVLLRRSAAPRAITLGLVVGGSAFVPQVSAPAELLAGFAAASFVLAAAAGVLFSGNGGFARAAPWLSLVLVAYMQAARLFGNQVFLREWALFALAILVIILSTGLQPRDLRPLAITLNFFLLFHLLYAASELFLRIPPVWPMGNGFSDLMYRPNFLVPELPGRAMTSFAHPIPLAVFALFMGVLNMYMFSLSRGRWLIGAVASFVLVVLTGTRSAIIAFILAAAVVLLFSGKIGAAVKATAVFFGAAVVGILAMNADSTLSVLGFGDGFEASNSYQYRTSVLSSAERILQQPTFQVLFGWGGDRAEIFRRGIIDGAGFGVLFFDNQFVAMAAMFGILAFLFFVSIILFTWIGGGVLSKALVVAFIMMGFGFDFLQYTTPALLFFFTASTTQLWRERDLVAVQQRRWERDAHPELLTSGPTSQANLWRH